MHKNRFPGETPQYRAARDELLVAERDLRARVEAVAAMRRKLPLGAVVPEDYVFEAGADDLDDATTTRKVRMSELFAPGKDTLVLYGFMYAPDAERPCPMCTSFTDGLDGNAIHLAQRVNLAIVGKSPIARMRAHARSRGWNNLRVLSSAGTNFGRDYHGDLPGGKQNSIIHVFANKPDGIHHTYSCELNMLPDEPGQNGRHIDLMWPLWNVLDLTPEGRGSTWYPALSY